MVLHDDSEQCCDNVLPENRFHHYENTSIVPNTDDIDFFCHHRQSPCKRRNRTTATMRNAKDHDDEQFASPHQEQRPKEYCLNSANRNVRKYFVVTKYHRRNNSPCRKIRRPISSLSHRVELCASIFLYMIVISILQSHFVYGDDDTSAVESFPTTNPGNTAPTPQPTIRFNVTVSTPRNTSLTNAPTPNLSDAPTAFPTNALSVVKSLYRQGFLLPVSRTQLFLNETEIESFTSVLESYTPILLQSDNTTSDNVQTNCSVLLQSGSTNTSNQIINDIDYRCQYSSRFVDVVDLPTNFLTFMNSNLNRFTTDLQENSININISFPASIRFAPSSVPTISPPPSMTPTIQPTTSTLPSVLPSIFPTELIRPTSDPEFVLPTSTFKPSPAIIDTNPGSNNGGLSLGGIVAIVIVGGLLCLAGLYLYYQSLQKRCDYNYSSNQQRQEQRSQRRYNNNASTSSTGMTTSVSGSRRHFLPTFRSNRQLDNAFAARPSVLRYNNSHNAMHDDIDIIHNPANYVISPTDSHLSNKSLISTGDSVVAEGSGDNDYDHHNIDEDGTKNLQDEFDLYKDQNLELLRTDVEGNLSGFEGYMSAAVTNALMGDDEKKNYEMQELLWGCDANPDGTEIEASALFEVTDWLNRNESAGMERKGAFMQEILNKMVTSVRFGVIVAEDASRTIHESAAILGLQLAEDLPVTTVIISGMRKTTRATDIINALNEFGDIDVAAVASGKRGFGIVRFRRRISVDHALQQYRAGEIVILDVSIQMKVLMPNGVLESR